VGEVNQSAEVEASGALLEADDLTLDTIIDRESIAVGRQFKMFN